MEIIGLGRKVLTLKYLFSNIHYRILKNKWKLGSWVEGF